MEASTSGRDAHSGEGLELAEVSAEIVRIYNRLFGQAPTDERLRRPNDISSEIFYLEPQVAL